jgi:hypothetical protein
VLHNGALLICSTQVSGTIVIAGISFFFFEQLVEKASLVTATVGSLIKFTSQIDFIIK